MNKYLIVTSMTCTVMILAIFNGCTAKLNSSTLNELMQSDRNKYITRINEMIKGREQVEVDSVFKNLKVLGGFPAENLVFAMEAWSKALGVSCAHCHDTNDFSLDTKDKKQIARDMVTMGNTISAQLKQISGLSDRPRINCYSCHRGELKPKLRE